VKKRDEYDGTGYTDVAQPPSAVLFLERHEKKLSRLFHPAELTIECLH